MEFLNRPFLEDVGFAETNCADTDYVNRLSSSYLWLLHAKHDGLVYRLLNMGYFMTYFNFASEVIFLNRFLRRIFLNLFIASQVVLQAMLS